jgi:DNA excision repair protein ERCC-4
VEISADLCERRSGVPEALRALGVEVGERVLPIGDYSVPGCLIERKEASDLHASIISGRVWRQLGKLRRSGDWIYLSIEGESLFHGPLSAEAVRGALLAVSDLGVPQIWSRDADDTAHWIRRIVLRRSVPRVRNRVPYAMRPPRPPDVDPAEQALTAAQGISTVTARALLDRFGCLTDVLLAPHSALTAVPGIGEKRALAIEALGGSGSRHFGASRNAGNRAT